MALPSSVFSAMRLPKLKVSSRPCAAAKEKSLPTKRLSLLPARAWSKPAGASCSPSASLPAKANRPSPPCVAEFSTMMLREHCSNIRMPAESCPRL
jgi:hypothetical protein